MAFRGGPVKAIVPIVVVVLIGVNGLAPWGDRVALGIDDGFQSGAALTAVVCGLLVGRRADGLQRWWRWLVAAGMACWAVGQMMWSWYQLVDGEGLPSPSLADVGYLTFPVCTLAALFVLASARHQPGAPPAPRQWTAHFGVAVILDGVVVTVCLFILAWSTGLGSALRDSKETNVAAYAVAVAYPATDLILVVIAVLLVVLDRVDRAYSANFLLLAAGIVALACSDSIFAYLLSTDAQRMKPWADAGYVLGPLLIAYALAARPPTSRPVPDGEVQAAAWWQVALPYLPVLTVGVMICGELLWGNGPDVVVTCLSILVIFLVLGRQILSSVDNNTLMRRVYGVQQQLIDQVHRDPLTGLVNRTLFARRLDRAAAERGPLVLVFVDLDDFKTVNDQFGHATGDHLLWAVGQRLLRSVRSTDTVARIGGDEYAVLLAGETRDPQAVAAHIRSILRQPFAIHGSSVTVGASMGLVVPDPEEPLWSADVLLGQADASMYAGKRSGKDTAVVYATSNDSDFPTALRHAHGAVPPGFRLVYQPIVTLPDARAVAVEALARWTTPGGVEVEPVTFVAAAERAGLGAALDMMVLDLACQQVAEAGLDLPVHVNMGAERLGHRVFEEFLAHTIRSHGTSPGQLVLEITETVPIDNLAEGAAAIRRLQERGVRVALDDFGAGYNSLTYLQALPIDVLKLDRALTAGSQLERDIPLYRAIIGLCTELGIDVIAEGVETPRQAMELHAAGCTMAQGYLYGLPSPLLRDHLRLSH
jgi:diguanylate cyclase (GGDEF)-like protein